MTTTLIDESNIEMTVMYGISPSQIEEGHGQHEVGKLVELSCVEMVIAGIGIDILPQMNNRQIDKIVSMLML